MRGAGNRRARREGALKRMQESLPYWKKYAAENPKSEEVARKLKVLVRDIECTKKNLGIGGTWGSPDTSIDIETVDKDDVIDSYDGSVIPGKIVRQIKNSGTFQGIPVDMDKVNRVLEELGPDDEVRD